MREGVTIQHPLPDDLVELIAHRLRVLSEPSRIKLLDHLRNGEASVLELTAAMETTEQNVSVRYRRQFAANLY
jgi:hypothetical protein